MTDDARTLHELERETQTDHASSDYWAQARTRVITAWITDLDPAAVIDVGCGSGYLTAQIASQNPGAHVKGIDTNEDSIRIAKNRRARAVFDVADAFDEPGFEHYDVVVLADIIEHYDDPAPLLESTERMLHNTGRVIVSVPAYRFLYGPHDEHNEHADRYNIKRLRSVAETAGFDVERARYTNALPLVPYFVTQRILRRPVPSGARGAHGPVVERLKAAALWVETVVPWPFGVSLIAQLERGDADD